MATKSTRSLMDLGPGCVNLERLCLGQTEFERFIATPYSSAGRMLWWDNEREYEHQFDQTVLSLLRRNPKLRVVKGIPLTDRPFLEALGNLKHLEELWFKGSFTSEILETCGAKLKVLCALGVNDDSFDGVCGSSWDDGVDLDVDRPQPVGTRTDCPLLEDLSFSSVGQMKLFFEKVKTPCLALRTLRVKIRKQSEVEVLERLVTKNCQMIEYLTLSYYGSLAGLDRIVATISKLQSLVIKGSTPDLPLIQAVEKHHRESLQVMKSNRPSGHELFPVPLAAGVAEALAHLKISCPRITEFK
ncbi:hypothetical protein BGX24_010310 [Mortierella sp. AD032]|nr:hypothetical protein BGX24_010310 [Mortierella sp. AD032]